jgi:hypothetical protein
MSDEQRARRLRVADSVVFRELDSEAIILNLETGTYFGLDGVGTQIWQRLERQESIDAVVAALVAEFDVESDRARADVLGLIGQLIHHGLMLAGDDGAAP